MPIWSGSGKILIYSHLFSQSIPLLLHHAAQLLLYWGYFVPDWGDGFGCYLFVVSEVEEVYVCLPPFPRAVPCKVSHLATFEACFSWSFCRHPIQRLIILWSSSFFQCSNLALVPLVSPSPSLWLVDPSSIKVHGDGGVIHLAGGIQWGLLSLLGIVLSPLVIVPIRSEVKRARLTIIRERVMRDAIPPSDNIVDCLPGLDCIHHLLL